jgi:hypothetical protein
MAASVEKIADQYRLRLRQRDPRALSPCLAPGMKHDHMPMVGREATRHQAEPIRRPGDDDICHFVLRCFSRGRRACSHHEKYPLSRMSVRSSGSCGRHPSELRVMELEVGLSMATKRASQSK